MGIGRCSAYLYGDGAFVFLPDAAQAGRIAQGEFQDGAAFRVGAAHALDAGCGGLALHDVP